MRPLELADRYGRSIFELAEAENRTDAIFQELAAVREAMKHRPELLQLLQNPFITRGEKCSLIEGILGPKANALSQQFLNLLVEKNRIDLYPFIVDKFHEILNGKQGIQEVTVVTARQLHPSIIQLVQKALEIAIGKKVVIQTGTDLHLLGGLQIRMGHRLIDGTLRSKLNSLDIKLRNVKV